MKALTILTILVSLGGCPPILAQSSPSTPHPCDSFNYIQTTEGECVDLSALTKMPVEPLDRQFYQEWEAIGVKVIQQDCLQGSSEQSSLDTLGNSLDSNITTYGLYYPHQNLLQLCTNAMKANPKQALDTIAHESWHIVQDCQGGEGSRSLLPIVSGNSPVRSLLQPLGATSISTMVNQLGLMDREDLQTLYTPEDVEVEIEARFLQHYPETVLEALKLCPQGF